jgi:membrane protein implicated in regulation of membrane protease activity
MLMVKDYLSVLVVVLTVLCLALLWLRFFRRREPDKQVKPLTDAQIKAAQEELAQYNFCFLKNDFQIWQVTKDLDKPIRTLQLRDTSKVEVVQIKPWH